MLKVFALVGLGVRANGGVTVADMDYIERSNLSRQFLFRPKDIRVSAGPSYILESQVALSSRAPVLSSQRPKAEVAAAAARRLNPDLRVTPYTCPLDPTTEDIYDDSFFSKVNGVVAALDSFQARKCLTGNPVPLPKPLAASLFTFFPFARALCRCSMHPLSEATAGGRHPGHSGECFSVCALCDRSLQRSCLGCSF